MTFKAIFHYPDKTRELQLIEEIARFRCRKVFEIIYTMGLSDKEHTKLIKQVLKMHENT